MSQEEYIDDKLASIRIKFCPDCNICWEKHMAADNRTITTSYYEDFPSIGLKREKCSSC